MQVAHERVELADGETVVLKFESLNLLSMGQAFESNSHGVLIHAVFVEVKSNNVFLLSCSLLID